MEHKIKPIQVLVVVDAQNDFITGSLANKDAQATVPNIVDKILKFNGDAIYLTMDTHYFDYLQTPEGKKLPVEHCMINTDGWRIESDINDAIIEKAKQGLEIKFIRKPTFGSVEPIYNENDSPKSLVDNINYLERKATFDYIKEHGYIDYIPMEIEICGFISDICVLHNAIILKAYTYNFAEITVDSKCCAGSTIENHNKAMDLLKIGQINVI